MHGDSAAARERVDLDALFIWSAMHGLAGVLNGQCIDKLKLKSKTTNQAIAHTMEMIGIGLANRP
jgi:hypothetical protein